MLKIFNKFNHLLKKYFNYTNLNFIMKILIFSKIKFISKHEH